MPYPTVPSRRMAYDDDGTVVVCRRYENYARPGDAFDALTAAEIVELNDEDNVRAYAVTPINSGTEQLYGLSFIFPEVREVDGFFAATEGAGPGDGLSQVQTSVDTTNGMDGTWVTQVASYSFVTDVYSNYRTGITSLAVSGARAVRQYWQTQDNQGWRYLRGTHIYGTILAATTPDRLLYVDATSGLEFTLPIDYGDIPRGSAEDRTLKLKNNSASLTAGTVQLTAESLYLASGNWYTMSEGGAFQSTLPLAASIGPGASSPTITLRRITPDSEDLGPHAGRLQATVGSWT